MNNKILKTIFIISGLLVILSVPLALWLKQDSTKTSIKNFIVDSLNNDENFHIEIGEIELNLPLIIKVKKVILSDKISKFAELDDLYVNIIPSIFFLWQINIWEIATEKISISRMPFFPSDESNNKGKSDHNIPNIIFHNINLKEVILSKELTKLDDELSLNVTSNMQLNFAKQNIDLQVAIQNFSHNIKLTADSNFDLTKQIFNLNYLKLDSQYLNLNAAVKIDAPTNLATGTIEYSSDLSNKIDDLQGTINGKLDFTGNLEEVALQLDHTTKAIYLNTALPELNIKSSAKIWPNNNKKAEGSLTYNIGNITGEGKYLWENELFNFITDANKNNNALKLSYNSLSNKLIADVNITNLALLDLIEPSIIHSGNISLKSKFLFDHNIASINSSGTIRDLKSDIFNLEKAEFYLNSHDLSQLKFTNSKLLIANFSTNSFNLTKAILSFHFADNKLVLSSETSTNSPFRSFMKTENYLTYQDGYVSIVMSKLEGEINETKIHLPAALRFNINGETNINNSKILLGSGHIDFAGNIKTDTINIHGSFIEIPSQLLQGLFSEEFANAKLDGKISLTGNRSSPTLGGNLSITGFHVAKNSDNGSIDIQFKNDFSSDPKVQKLIFAGHIHNASQKLCDISASLPIIFSSSPWDFRFLTNDPFEAKLKTTQNVNLLSYINMPTGHKLGGELNGYININGTLNNPKINANLDVTNGKYSYKAIGVKTKNINGKIKTTNNKIIFNDFKIGDYFGNIMSAQGHYDINNNGSFDFKFASNKFNLFSNQLVQGQAQGDVRIVGNNEGGQAKGKVVIGPLDIKIPERLNNNIPTINVVKVINEHEDIYQLATSNPYKLTLDIEASTNEQVFVSGRGVKTKLVGDLHLIGSAQNPEIIGKLVSVHGKYQDFGRQLEIRQGEIIFDGPIPPSPYLNITGVAEEGSYEIHLNLTGSIIDPKIDISSIPALNQEEAMSILLFGENPDSISALQALQLANSMSKLSGGKTIDPLKAIPIDDISIKNDKNNPENTIVGIGKYLTDKVYFEVEQNAQDSNTKTKVEVEISPKVSIEGATETSGNSSMGINWRFDY